MAASKKVAARKTTAADTDIAYPEALPQYFVDGVAATQLGPHHTKITFQNTAARTGKGKGKRQASHTIVIPTAVLLSYMKNLRGIIARSAPQLRAAPNQLDKALQEFLANPALSVTQKGRMH